MSRFVCFVLFAVGLVAAMAIVLPWVAPILTGLMHWSDGVRERFVTKVKKARKPQ